MLLWTLVILLDDGISLPSKYFFNAATPELIHKRVGSLCGIKDEPCSTLWPLLLKKFYHVLRISFELNFFIIPPRNNKKVPTLRNDYNRGTILILSSRKHLINFVTPSSTSSISRFARSGLSTLTSCPFHQPALARREI